MNINNSKIARLVMMKKLILVALCLLLLPILGQNNVALGQMIQADSTNSMWIHWTAPGDDGAFGTASMYDIRYSATSMDYENVWEADSVLDTSFAPSVAGSYQEYLVIGLNPGTTYHFALRAADETYFHHNSPPLAPVNWSQWSNIVSKKTDHGILSGGPFKFFLWNFNGDQYKDLGLRDLSTGNLYAAVRDSSSKSFIWSDIPVIEGFAGPTDQLLVDDFNHDGYDDACLYIATGGLWRVALNNYLMTGGLVDDGYWLEAWASGGIGGSSDWIPMVLDASGDEYPDICVYRPSQGRLVVAYNWGDHFAQASGIWLDGWGVGTYGAYLPFTGKLNLGPKEDVGMYHPVTGRWFPAMSNSPDPHFIKDGLWLDNWAKNQTGISYLHFCGLLIPKENHLDDILVGTLALGRWYGAENTGTSFVRKYGKYMNQGGCWLDNWPNKPNRDKFQYAFNDISGDGYGDLVAFDSTIGSVEVAYNYGSKNPPYLLPVDGAEVNNAWITGWGVSTSAVAKTANENVGGIDSEDTTITLGQNYPNPFNPTTTISYSLTEATHVTLDILNILGQRVETLVDQDQPAGDHSLEWNASQYATGVYFYRFTTDMKTETKKMLLIK